MSLVELHLAAVAAVVALDPVFAAVLDVLLRLEL